MGLTDKIAVICLEAIDNKSERNKVISSLESTGKEIIEITEEQVAQFAGNVIGLRNNKEDEFLIMSEMALNSFTDNQRDVIEGYYENVPGQCEDG